jgi:hypothetical protein
MCVVQKIDEISVKIPPPAALCSTASLVYAGPAAMMLGNIAATAFFAIWELPQNLCGIAVFLVLRLADGVRATARDGRFLYVQTRGLAVSLGWFVFWVAWLGPGGDGARERNRRHEYGHTVQSRIFGPLYLVLIGLPSAARAVYARLYFAAHKRPWNGYYRGYPENWADRLGGISSSERQ